MKRKPPTAKGKLIKIDRIKSRGVIRTPQIIAVEGTQHSPTTWTATSKAVDEYLKPRKISWLSKKTPPLREPKRDKPPKITWLTKTPPKKRKTARLDPLDVLFSEFIRRRAIQRVGGCERCLTPKRDVQKDDGSIFPAWKNLQCSHFFGRTDKATRFDPENAIGACGACHMYLEHHPTYHVQWFEKHLGKEAYEMLEGRNRIMGKPDKKALTLYYQIKIKEMTDNV